MKKRALIPATMPRIKKADSAADLVTADNPSFLASSILVWGLLVLIALGGNKAQAEGVVVAGDSVLAWNASRGQSVSQALSRTLDAPVRRLALAGAGVLSGIRRTVPNQVRRVSGGVAILNGGANDLARLCGCRACDTVLDQLISADGTRGTIVQMIRDLRARDVQVIWVFYYDAPRGGGPFSACANEIDEMEARITSLATRLAGVRTLDLARAINPDISDHYDRDRIHPSPLGSARIAALIAQALR